MPKLVQAIKKKSGFKLDVCCNVFSCGFPYTEYGQYVFPDDEHKPLAQSMILEDDFPYHTNDFSRSDNKEKSYTVTTERLGGCELTIPCVLSLGCPSYEYNYKNNQTGQFILPLPRLSEEQVTQQQSDLVKGTISTQKAHLKVCCCCGFSANLSKKIGFFSTREKAGEQNPPAYTQPQTMTMS